MIPYSVTQNATYYATDPEEKTGAAYQLIDFSIEIPPPTFVCQDTKLAAALIVVRVGCHPEKGTKVSPLLGKP